MPKLKLTAIDDSNRADHSYLTDADECFFLLEYTAGKRYDFSDTNNLISNLKKRPSERQRPGFQYKARAIAQASEMLRGTINPEWLQTATLVPVPGSKALDHIDYDDRVERVCRGIRPTPPLDVRCLVRQTESTEAFHVGTGNRVRPSELAQRYAIDESLCDPEPTAIGIFDDVLTAGTHFRAMQMVLHRRFPNVETTGIFIARRVFAKPEDEFDDVIDF